MKTFTKKALATILSLCFILSVVSTTVFAMPEIESRFEGINVPDDYAVTAIVVFDDPSLSEMGYSPADIRAGKADKALSKIEQKHAEFAAEIGDDGDVCYTYTSVLNGMAVETTYSKLKAFEKMNGVKKVYIANTYTVPEVESGNELITGALEVVANGYTGDGITLAVLDTGTHTTHEAFADYGIITKPAITEEQIAAFEGYAEPKYISTKIPFAYDYADGDDDVTDINPDTGGHGTHCAGIALGYAEKDGEATFTGTAPAAQLVAMKIFKDDVSTTNSGIYYAALDDCYTLGVDIVSMSIGSDYGFTYDDELEFEVFGNIFKTLDDAGIIVCVSAGNSGNQSSNAQNWLAVNNLSGYLTTDYVDYGTVGSPATYFGNIAVASIENATLMMDGFLAADDTPIAFIDAGEGDLAWYKKFENQTHEIVFIGGVGEDKDYEGIDVTGKIAVVKRGTTTFQEKHDAAKKAGAIGMICWNTTEEPIRMQIDAQTIPAVCIPDSHGTYLKQIFDEGKKTVTIKKVSAYMVNETFGQVSDFSGWGPAPDLTMAPQISGVGGYVVSASYTGDQDYIMMSGTSMACPNVAGMFALTLEALREKYPEMSKKDMAELAENKALSTGTFAIDAYEDIAPINHQGTGIFTPANAIAAEHYFINPISDGIKNVSADGKYTFDITVARDCKDGAESIELEPIFGIDAPAGQNWGSKENPDYTFYNTFTSMWLEAESGDGKGDYTFTVNTESGKVDFAEGETEVTVSVTVTLSEGLKESIDYYFANGTYIYGYVMIADDEYNAHSTFLGYYGDFDKAPAAEFDFTSFEMVDIDYILNTYPANANGDTFADLGYEYYNIVESDLGYTLIASYGEYNGEGAVWHLGGNVFESVTFDPDHVAFSGPFAEGGYFADGFAIQPIVYRNLAHFVMTVTPEGYDKPVYIDDTPYVRKSTGEADGNYSYFQWNGEIYDEDGEIIGFVENGTKCTIKFYAQLAYEGAELKEIFSFDALVDCVAPEVIYHYNAETREFTFKASDNHIMQYLDIYIADKGDTQFDTIYSISPDKFDTIGEGGTITGTVKIPEGVKTIGCDIMDYATNYNVYAIPCDKSSTNQTYTVKAGGYYSLNGYKIKPVSECDVTVDDDNIQYFTQIEGTDVKFTVEPDKYYTVTKDFKVIVDGTTLTADDKGVYSFKLTKDTEIIVEGIKDTTAPELYLTDDTFVDDLPAESVISGSMIIGQYAYDPASGVKDYGFAFSTTEYDLEKVLSSDAEFYSFVGAHDWSDYNIGLYDAYGIGYIYAYAVDYAGNYNAIGVKVINDFKGPEFSSAVTDHGTNVIIGVYDEMHDIASVEVDGVDAKYVKIVFEAGDAVITISGMPNDIYDIKVTAKDKLGNVSVYNIGVEVDYVPEIVNDDLYLVGVQAQQTVADLKAMYKGDITVYDKNGDEMEDTDRITTGCTVEYCGTTITLIVRGDVNKDGKITIADATMIKRAIMGLTTFDDEQFAAASVANGAKLSIKDYTMIKRHIQGFSSIYAD